MSASEFAFLALGLVLGIASGAAIVEVLRARPPAPREVRLTLTPDSVPRRPSTLAGSVLPSAIGPAEFGPADRREAERAPSGSEAQTARRRRTGVPSAETVGELGWPLVGIPIEPEPDRVLAALRATPVAVATAPDRSARVFRDDDDLRGGPFGEEAHAGGLVGTAGRGADAGASNAPDEASLTTPATAASAPGQAPDPAPPGPAADGCADLRRLAAERCAEADRATAQATSAAAALREREREADEREARVTRAEAESDHGALRAAKEAAQRQFRSSSSGASDPAAVEAAARMWLQEISRINGTAREAAVTLRREREALNALVPILEQLSVAADSARITAEAAREACLACREAVAACDEAAGRERDALAAAAREREALEAAAAAEGGPADDGAADAPGGPADDGAADAPGGPADDGAAGEGSTLDADGGGGRPGARILTLLLAGDRAALREVAVAAAGDDAGRQGGLQLLLSELVDAIRASAIEASQLDFPIDSGFWEPFTRAQSREIVGALASLGYRFDGNGGFGDGRVPTQRDLSRAVGFTGLDPMRIRRWPNEAEMADIFDGVTVAADEWVVATAPGLSLAEMVAMLGPRADGLTELWEEWGRIRRLLAAPA